MQTDNEVNNYKLKKSYKNKIGFEIKSYMTCYNSEDTKICMNEEITKSCIRIFDNIKN